MPALDREKQILRAAEELFTTRRFHEVTLDHVCRKAGVGKGTIYRYFNSKEDLFQQMVLSGFSDLCEAIRLGQDGQVDFVDRLSHALLETRKFFVRRRSMFRVLQSEEERASFKKRDLHNQWKERRKDLISAISAILDDGITNGHLRSDVPAELLSATLLGMMRGYFSQQSDHEVSLGSLKMFLDLFLKGAAPTPAAH